ncbi:hypothetical protein OSTOST_24308 [Ostertagia ostertagi]
MYEERMRIQKAGGTVRDGRVNVIIEVTCVPDMKKLTITERDRTLGPPLIQAPKTVTFDTKVQNHFKRFRMASTKIAGLIS